MTPEERAVFQLFKRALALKELLRTGAIIEGAIRSEADTIAAHSWAVCLLSLLIATHLKKEFSDVVDVGRIATMAVLHDLNECVTGDLPAALKRVLKDFAPNVSAELESRVTSILLSGLAGKDDLLGVLSEYETRSSAAAKIVKFADIVEAWAHLQLRLNRQFPRNLEEADRVLRNGSPECDCGVGNRLADLLQSCRQEWDDIGPTPIVTRGASATAYAPLLPGIVSEQFPLGGFQTILNSRSKAVRVVLGKLLDVSAEMVAC